MDNVLIDDRRIHVDFSQSVSHLHQQFLFNKKGGGGFGGSETLVKRTKYRDGDETGDVDYDLVFEHQGSLEGEKDAPSSDSRKRQEEKRGRDDSFQDRDRKRLDHRSQPYPRDREHHRRDSRSRHDSREDYDRDYRRDRDRRR